MKSRSVIIFIMACSLSLGSCITTQPSETNPVILTKDSKQPDQSTLLYSVFLLGDAGNATRSPLEPTLKVLKQKISDIQPHGAVLFLGDNAMPDGLPEPDSPEREKIEKRLNAQLGSVSDFSGDILFLPGNHDWSSSGKSGSEAVKRQEAYIEQYLNRGNTFVPDSSKPGPENIVFRGKNAFKLNIVALDLQWWLHKHKKPLMGHRTVEAAQEDFLQNVHAAVTDTIIDNLLIVSHHPLYSYGPRGGYLPLKTHFLPPVAGSIYAFHRKAFGNKKDIKSYEDLKERLLHIFEQRGSFIYASGHDHSLQYINFGEDRSGQHFIISGSASSTRFVKEPDPPSFAIQQNGFAVIKFYETGTWLEFWNYKNQRIFEQVLN